MYISLLYPSCLFVFINILFCMSSLILTRPIPICYSLLFVDNIFKYLKLFIIYYLVFTVFSYFFLIFPTFCPCRWYFPAGGACLCVACGFQDQSVRPWARRRGHPMAPGGGSSPGPNLYPWWGPATKLKSPPPGLEPVT